MPVRRAVRRSCAVLRAQSWAYDASSKVTHHTVDGVTTAFTYDGAGQLLSESRPGYLATYTYDGNGNRLTRTVNGVTKAYTYDAGDKLLSVSVGGQVVKSYTYDAAGRTTTVTSSAGTTTLTYDFEGRATSIVGPGVSQFNVFNGLDTRVGSTTNSVTRTFLRDGAYVTDPVLSDGAAFYTIGVSERRGGVTTFLHSGLKNADAQSTASGLSAARQYDAFGNLLSSSGAWQGPFGYAGAFGYQEDATGLMLLGHRLYAGRFLTRDPIQDGRNWYVYCGNDPINYFDWDGQWRRRVIDFWNQHLGDGVRTFGKRIKVVFFVSSVVKFGVDYYLVFHEANLYYKYRRMVKEAMAEGDLRVCDGHTMLNRNRPGMGGLFRVIEGHYELLEYYYDSVPVR